MGVIILAIVAGVSLVPETLLVTAAPLVRASGAEHPKRGLAEPARRGLVAAAPPPLLLLLSLVLVLPVGAGFVAVVAAEAWLLPRRDRYSLRSVPFRPHRQPAALVHEVFDTKAHRGYLRHRVGEGGGDGWDEVTNKSFF